MRNHAYMLLSPVHHHFDAAACLFRLRMLADAYNLLN